MIKRRQHFHFAFVLLLLCNNFSTCQSASDIGTLIASLARDVENAIANSNGNNNNSNQQQQQQQQQSIASQFIQIATSAAAAQFGQQQPSVTPQQPQPTATATAGLVDCGRLEQHKPVIHTTTLQNNPNPLLCKIMFI